MCNSRRLVNSEATIDLVKRPCELTNNSWTLEVTSILSQKKISSEHKLLQRSNTIQAQCAFTKMTEMHFTTQKNSKNSSRKARLLKAITVTIMGPVSRQETFKFLLNRALVISSLIQFLMHTLMIEGNKEMNCPKTQLSFTSKTSSKFK